MSEIRRKNFMDLETYKEIVDAPILARIKRTAIKHVYNLLDRNSDQREALYVEGLYEEYSMDTIDTLANFGILDSKRPKDVLNRVYVILISKDKLNNLEGYINSFKSNYLPRNAKIGAYILEDNYTKQEEYTEVLETIAEYLPEADCLNRNSELEDIRIQLSVLSEIKDRYREIGFEKFVDIEDLVTDVENEVRGNHLITAKIIIEGCKKLVEENEEKTIFYSSRENQTYTSIATYLQYFHDRTCITVNRGGQFKVDLGRLFYSPINMLMEDRIRYLRSFPTFTFKQNDFSTFFLVTYSRKVTSKLSLFKLNRNNEIAEDSELISIDLNFSEKTNYDLISVYDLFDFKTNDIKTLRDVDKIVVRLLLDLSQRLEKRYLLTGLDKVIFLRNKDTEEIFIAYVEDLKFSTLSMLTDNVLNRVRSYTIKEEEVFTWLPLDCVVRANAYKKLVVNNLRSTSMEVLKTTGIKLKEVKALKLTSNMAFVFRHFFTNGRAKRLSDEGYRTSDFIDLCLNAVTYLDFRSTDHGNVLNQLNIGVDFHDYVNCFMSFDPITNKKIKINEKILAQPIRY